MQPVIKSDERHFSADAIENGDNTQITRFTPNLRNLRKICITRINDKHRPMNTFELALQQAFVLITDTRAEGHDDLLSIATLSLRVAAASASLACLIGLPLGTWLAIHRFPGRGFVVAFLNAMLGLPSVIVGLITYLLMSRSGPFGSFGLLFSPVAMIIAQTILITPMVAALARQPIETAWTDYQEFFVSIGAGSWLRLKSLLWDCRLALVTVVLTALGRALSEVGAVMTVGGNIAGSTRVMTTAIALETSKGDLPLALALGIILLSMVLTIMMVAQTLSSRAARA